MLQRLYEDPKEHSFAFQIMAMSTRASAVRSALQQLASRRSDKQIIFIERSLLADKHVFAVQAKQNGHIKYPESWIYDTTHEALYGDDIAPDIIVHLRPAMEVTLARMYQRGRAEEQLLPISAVQQLDALHIQWLAGQSTPTLILTDNTSADIEQMMDFINLHVGTVN